MTFNLYSIRDRIGSFSAPTLDTNDSIAIRNFAFGFLRRPSSMIEFSPEDFSLFRIGTFDSETASIVSYTPVFVADARSAGLAFGGDHNASAT